MATTPSGPASGPATEAQLTEAQLQALLGDGQLAGSWTLDPARSRVRLTTRHTWGLLPLHGGFEKATGRGTVTPAGEVSGVLAVNAESISTKNPRRDKHLRSPAFFDIDNHPEITFTAESAAPSGRGASGPTGSPGSGTVRFTGQLTVAGQTRPAMVDATVSRAGDELTVDGQLQVDRREFGLTWNFIGIAGNHSTIDVHAVFARTS
jgi:polyisoprenoid-binding protein YceI